VDGAGVSRRSFLKRTTAISLGAIAARGIYGALDEESSGGNAGFQLQGNTIGGNLTLTKSSGEILIGGNTVRGNLQLVENAAAATIADNVVTGDLQLFKTRGPSAVLTNRIRQNLQCGENQPRTVGGGNSAAGKQGQCRLL
jgi:hypothetical protein